MNGSYLGEEFLCRVYPGLHTSKEVERRARKSDTPKEKVSRYLKKLEEITEKAISEENINHDNDSNLLRQMYYRKYLIREENVPESYFELQKRIALERGDGYLEYDEETKAREVSQIINVQKQSLDNWLDYLNGPDTKQYPMWFKYYAFQGMVKLGSFDKKNGKYSKRTESTVKPFAELDREALAVVFDELIRYLNKEQIDDENLRNLLQGGNFGKIYADAKRRIDEVQKDDTKSDEGIWKKYEQGSDPEILYNDIQGKGTGWCTAGALDTAREHLDGGDFYVYFTKDKYGKFTCPRIAIRKEEGKIAEIRGIAEDQNIESNMERAVQEKLKEPDFPDREEYQRKVECMQMMTYVHTKWKNGGQLTVQDLKFLYEVDEPIIGFGYQKDPRIEEITSTRDVRKDLATAFGISENEISMTLEEALSGNKKVHFGNIDLSGLPKLKDFTFPEYVYGSIIAYHIYGSKGCTSIENVTFPKRVRNIDLSSVKKLKDVTFPGIVNSLNLYKVENVENVVFPPKVKYFELTNVKEMSNVTFPEEIEETCEMSGVVSLSDVTLPKIVGRLNLHTLSKISNVTFPEKVSQLSLDSLSLDKDVQLPREMSSLTVGSISNSNVIRQIAESNLITLMMGINAKDLGTLQLPSKLQFLSLKVDGKLNELNLLPIETVHLEAKDFGKVTFSKGTKDATIRVNKVDTLTLPDEVERVIINSTEINTVTMPDKAQTVILDIGNVDKPIKLPTNMEKCRIKSLKDLNKIVVSEKEEERKKVVEALANGQTGKKDDFTSKLIGKINSGYGIPQLEQVSKPKEVKATSGIFSKLGKKVSSLYKNGLVSTKKSLLSLKDKIMNAEKERVAGESELSNTDTPVVSDEEGVIKR